MASIAATRPTGVWENIKYYADEPKIWAVISLAGVIASLVLKIHFVAVLSIYILGASLVSLYERHTNTKELEELVREQADYNQWLTRLEGIIAPRGGIQSVEDIEIPADPQAFLDCINAGGLLYLTPYEMDDLQVNDFGTLLARQDRNVRINRMIRDKIFAFYQNARRQLLDYEARQELYETNVQRGMRWFC